MPEGMMILNALHQIISILKRAFRQFPLKL